MTTPFLTDDEIQQLTHYRRRDCQERALRHMGIVAKRRPDGSLAVLRTHIEKEFDGLSVSKAQKQEQPNFAEVH